MNISTMSKERTLYEVTGNIKDINSILVDRAKLVRLEEKLTRIERLVDRQLTIPQAMLIGGCPRCGSQTCVAMACVQRVTSLEAQAQNLILEKP